jgi:single-strand selective monofunctional uracil DNA glycosylase
VSGTRLWGFARERFKTAERFGQDFFVANYCPLVFMEAGGKNLTPDKLPRTEQAALFLACDEALRRIVAELTPRFVIGVGAFAEARVRAALPDSKLEIGTILHPSPASPKANRGWAAIAEAQLEELGAL